MDVTTIVYAGSVLFIAYLVRGMVGFGSGLIAVPLLALRFPLPVVVPLVVSLDYIGSASQGIKNREHIAWRDQLPLIPFMLLGVGVGLFFLKVVKTAVLSKVLGGFIIVYAMYQLLPAVPLQASRITAIAWGFLGGAVGALFGTGGPFYVIYFNLRRLENSVFRATFALNYLIDGAIRLIAYAIMGLWQWDTLLALLSALPVAAVGLYVGGRVHTGCSPTTFVRLVSLLLLSSGLALLLK
jgi:uncharacterized membrane protein YfcA